MYWFISGPQGAADSARIIDEVAPITLAQHSCFVHTSLLIPEVPGCWVETPRVDPRIQKVASSSSSACTVLPQVHLLFGSSNSLDDLLSQMRNMIDEVLTQTLIQ